MHETNVTSKVLIVNQLFFSAGETCVSWTSGQCQFSTLKMGNGQFRTSLTVDITVLPGEIVHFMWNSAVKDKKPFLVRK